MTGVRGLTSESISSSTTTISTTTVTDSFLPLSGESGEYHMADEGQTQ